MVSPKLEAVNHKYLRVKELSRSRAECVDMARMPKNVNEVDQYFTATRVGEKGKCHDIVCEAVDIVGGCTYGVKVNKWMGRGFLVHTT